MKGNIYWNNVRDLLCAREKELLLKDNQLSKDDYSLILSALNIHWNTAYYMLKSSILGDLERTMYEQQRDESKALMDKIEKL